MGQGLFVTGAGTEIGKTLIAAALVHQLVSRGQAVRVLKPVISGFDPTQPEMSDTGRLLTAAGIEVTDQAIARASPWRFAEPIAPNMAANRAGAPIDLDKVVAHCRAGLSGDGVLVIEGVGGVMAPITDEETVIDWGVVVSESADQPVPLAETSAAVVGFLPHTPVIGVPRIPLRPRPWEAVPDLTALVDLPETL